MLPYTINLVLRMVTVVLFGYISTFYLWDVLNMYPLSALTE